MTISKPRYEQPKIVPVSDLAEAVGAGNQCPGGKVGFAEPCKAGSGGYSREDSGPI
jgi:hypothetical protein